MKSVYIAGVARSGTSWLGQIFNSSPDVQFRFQPLFSYELKGRVNEDSSSEDYQKFLNDMAECKTDFLTQQKAIEQGIYPRFDKNEVHSHLVFKENRYQSIIEPMLRRNSNVCALGIIRHPCAVLHSWTNNEKEFPPGSDIRSEWRFGSCKNSGNEDYFGYYKWKEVANMYLDLALKYPDRFYLVQYEELLNRTIEKAKDMFMFFGIPWSKQTQDFLISSHSSHLDSYYSVFKNPISLRNPTWKSKLPEFIVNEIYSDLKGTRLERFLTTEDSPNQ